MRRVVRDLWLCVDCTIAECNGDYSGMSDVRAAEVSAAFERLNTSISANFDSETRDGIREFSRCGCDVCGSHLAGEMHRFAVLGE